MIRNKGGIYWQYALHCLKRMNEVPIGTKGMIQRMGTFVLPFGFITNRLESVSAESQKRG